MIRAASFRRRGGWGRRAGANALTIFFEMSSNFFENVHHFGNCGLIGCGARNAGVRCERRKGKIQLSAKTA